MEGPWQEAPELHGLFLEQLTVLLARAADTSPNYAK
jgi:hypothetical protein